jgi:FlaA1/EpsC-like NDP-sugar epimerase
MKTVLKSLLSLPRRSKQLVLMVADFFAFSSLLWAALALRYGTTTLTPLLEPNVVFDIPLISALTVFLLLACGVYRAVVRAFDEKFLQNILLAVVMIMAVFFVVVFSKSLPLPRSTPLIFGFFVFVWVWASRSGIRRLVRMLAHLQVPVIRLAIYGAGPAGQQMLAALRSAPEYFPVAFFDDDYGVAGSTVQGLYVYSGKDFERRHKQLSLDEVLIALPSSSRTSRREIIKRLELFKVRVRTLPSITQLMNGQVSISDIREVDITDLLGRDPVSPSVDLLGKDITGKCVLVTGAGGSIGSELCRQILAVQPAVLILWEMSELALYHIEKEAHALSAKTKIIPVLGSVLHQARMTRLMQHYHVDTVYHAAAYKHVPMVERNPFEGLLNNAAGTWHAARAAVEAGVSTFVLISTDKAVRPTNIMGASKRLAEMLLQAMAVQPGGKTRFCMVRFGNVLGSSGSVVPLFREQIARGGPVTVTHPDVTRFFMTIPEASQLVIQAGAMGLGGDVFVLDMGESIKIVDLARKMIHLSGMSVREAGPAEAEGDIDIVYSGLRPGEKLYEELLIGSTVTGTDNPRIMRAMENTLPYAELELLMEKIYSLARLYDVVGLKKLLQSCIEGYVPDMSVFGFLDAASDACCASASDADHSLSGEVSASKNVIPLSGSLKK